VGRRRSDRGLRVLPSPVTRAFAAALATLLIGAPAAHAADLPLQLPGDASASSVRSDPDSWLVGGVPGERTASIAKRFGAEHFGLPETGGYKVARQDARAFAAALRERGLLVYASANVKVKPLKAVPDDPLSVAPNAWRAQVASPDLTPPPVTPESPLIALVDAAADLAHPEWAGSNATTIPGTAITNSHGTATMSVAAAPLNGVGILGVWPGARALNVPLATVPGTDGEITCDASGDAIAAAVQAGASVINMSYGSPSRCAAEWVQLYFAVARGIIPVAAAGNEFESGNPLEFPASLPHVVTVAATTPDDKSARFSNANNAVDISAPGVGIMTAVPPALPDPDGAQDGYQAQSGTSFSAPMVSAAMAWVRAARPDLTPDRVIHAVRLSARDVERKGWDPLTGFGVLNVGAALALPTDKLPIHDPQEPNDNLVWVNGKAFGKANAAVWSGGSAKRVSGLLDKQEDPIDVYRIVIGASKTAKISVIPRFGDPSLEVFPSSAVSVNDVDERVAISRLAGSKKTERASVTNTGTKKRSYYVVVRPQGNSRYQEREYTLRVG
jgi:subtilisin family serine protease